MADPVVDPVDTPTATDTPKEKLSSADKKEILEEARKRFADVSDRDQKNRDRAKAATKFVYVSGQQWDSKIRTARDAEGSPTLEFPQLKQFVNQVVNDMRQGRPGIRVHAAGSLASKETADILQGMARGIEYESQAEAAYDSGFSNSVVGGRGYWRVCTEYESAKSFNQNLRIKRVADPLTVYPDIDYQEPDGSDQNFCFVTESMKRGEFEKRYPKAKAVGWGSAADTKDWYPDKDTILVADYYRRVAVDRTLVVMNDGAIGWKDELPKILPPGITIERERDAQDYRVEWHVLGGGEEVLESHDWPGTIVPVIICVGDEVMIDGERMFDGLISQAMDAQRLYNYEQSAKAQNLMMQPISPYIGPKEAFDGLETVWQQANTKKLSYLPYNAYDEQERPVQPPSRIMPPQVPTGWAESSQSMKQDMKSIIGMYENSLGLHGQEVSGRAILAREKQGDNATFHFVDNLSRAIALTGRIIVELIPHYYDTQRIVTTVGTDDTRELVTINEKDPLQAIAKNDVTVGDYAVTVEAGPSYSTKREEVRESLMALVQSFPQVMGVAGDIIAGTLDFDGSDDLAERMKVMLPPPVQQMLAAKEQKQDPKLAAANAKLEQTVKEGHAAVAQVQGEAQKVMQENAALKAKLAGKEGDLQLTARKDEGELSVRMRELDLREKELALKEGEAEVTAILKASELQQKQAEPIANTMADAQPAVEAAVHDEPIQKIAESMAALHKMVGDLAGKVGEVEKSAKSPRSLRIHFDENGEPIGGESRMLQ